MRSEEDLFLRGVGLDFRLTRTYNSDLYFYNSRFGAGWENSTYRMLKGFGAVNTPGFPGVEPDKIQVVSGSGRPQYEYKPLTTKPHWFQSDSGDDWMEYEDAASSASGVETMVLYSPNGIREYFEQLDVTQEWFYLRKTVDMFGNTVSFHYAASPSGFGQAWTLDYVIDTVGREISFFYNSENRMASVEVRSSQGGGAITAQVNYDYFVAEANGDIKLKEVTGAEIATAGLNGQVQMIRPVTQYEYWHETIGAEGWILSKVTNGEGQVEIAWTYLSGQYGLVDTETHRPGGTLRASGEGTYEYEYLGSFTKHFDPDGGRVDYLRDANDLIGTKRVWVDGGNYLDTIYHYDTGFCTTCSLYSSIDYPDGSSVEFVYDDWKNLIAQWWHPATGSLAPSRVERWKWSAYDPENGLYRSNLLEHELIRDAHPNEDPQNSCTNPSCQQSSNASGHIVYFFDWSAAIVPPPGSSSAPLPVGAKLEHADYGSVKVDAAGITLGSTEDFEYFSNGLVKRHVVNGGGGEIFRSEFTLHPGGGYINSIDLIDTQNGGHWLTTYQADNSFLRMYSRTGPDGVHTNFRWDTSGNLYRILEDTDDGGNSPTRTTENCYDLVGRLIKATVEGANGITSKSMIRYDESGYPYEIEHTGPGGTPKIGQIHYSKGGLETKVIDWRGWEEEVVYGYGALHLPVEGKETHNSNTQTTWRAGDGSTGSSPHPGYDNMGRLLSFRNALDWLSYLEWDGHGRQTKSFSQTEPGYFSARSYKYDARGYVREFEVGAIAGSPSSITSSQWLQHHVLKNNVVGHLLSHKVFESGASNEARLTTYEVDGLGRNVVITKYLGNRTSGAAPTPVVSEFAYDALNRILLQSTLSNGTGSAPSRTRDFWYDDAQKIVTQVMTEQVGGASTKLDARYSNLGALTAKTEYAWSGGGWSSSRTWAYDVDGLNRLVGVEDPLGIRDEWVLDEFGRVRTAVKRPNAPGQLLTTSYAYNSTTGVLDSVTDAEGKVTAYTYFSTWLHPKKATYQDGRIFEILEYDAVGRRLSTKDDRGVIHLFDYGNSIYLNKDSAVIPNTQLVPGPEQLRWEFDPWTGRQSKSKVIESGQVVWGTAFAHNDLGEKTSETQGLGQQALTWNWAYGFAGELQSVSYPNGLGLDQGAFSYDGAGRVDAVQYLKGAATIANYSLLYDGFRPIGRNESVSGIHAGFSYDSYGRLDRLAWDHLVGGSSVELDGQSRAFDLADHVSSRQRVLDTLGESFVHDGYGRMAQWFEGVDAAQGTNASGVPNSYSNVTQYNLNSVYGRASVETGPDLNTLASESYVSNDAHFYTQVGTQARTSTSGYLNSDGTYYYRYDAWGRLTEVEEIASPHTLVRRHHYDAEGRRVRSEETGGGATSVSRMVYWGARLAATFTEGTPISNVRTYGYLGGADSEAFVVDGNTGATFELARDFQGSILALIDRATQAVVERYRYSPFGEVSMEDASGQALTQSAHGNDRFYLGRVLDAELGIYDLRNRWYDPVTGSFLSPDPLLAVDSWNMYQYGFGTPATWMDPFGDNVRVEAATNVWGQHYRVVVDTYDANGVKNGEFGVGYYADGGWPWDGQGQWPPQSGPSDPADDGEVFVDSAGNPVPTSEAGPGQAVAKVLLEIETSSDEDAKILDYLKDQVGKKGKYNLGGADCQQFAIDTIRKIIKKLNKSRGSDGGQVPSWLKSANSGLSNSGPIGTYFVCFAKGTLVLTKDGLKPIEDVEVGEFVESYDLEAGSWVYGRVENLRKHHFYGPIALIVVGEDSFVATGTHPFWVVSGKNLENREWTMNQEAISGVSTIPGRWVTAGSLLPGDVLLSKKGFPLVVSSVNLSIGEMDVYNLSVEGPKNFLVGVGGILVHNS